MQFPNQASQFAIHRIYPVLPVHHKKNEIALCHRRVLRTPALRPSTGFHPCPTIPPVSQSLNSFPPISHLAEIRSRVIPGWPCTIAMRRPAIRLNNADFPTFGRPTMAMFIAKRSTGISNASPAGPRAKGNLPVSLAQGLLFCSRQRVAWA